MGWECSGVVRFDREPLLQGQTRIPEPKSAYNSLILVSRNKTIAIGKFKVQGQKTGRHHREAIRKVS